MEYPPGATILERDNPFPSTRTKEEAVASLNMMFASLEMLNITTYDDHFKVVGNTGVVWGYYTETADNRYHSIFGGDRGCMAVHPGDTAPALVALDARIVTSSGRVIRSGEFWEVNNLKSTVLEESEMVTEIQVPAPGAGVKSAFVKYTLRKSIDFPVVNCAAQIGGGIARICLNAVYNTPYRATEAEKFIAGRRINGTNAESAGSIAVEGSRALPMNKWKVQLAKVMVKEAVLACA